MGSIELSPFFVFYFVVFPESICMIYSYVHYVFFCKIEIENSSSSIQVVVATKILKTWLVVTVHFCKNRRDHGSHPSNWQFVKADRGNKEMHPKRVKIAGVYNPKQAQLSSGKNTISSFELRDSVQ